MMNNGFIQYLNSLNVNKFTFYDFHEYICTEEKSQPAIGFLLKGNAEFYIDDKAVELKEGQIIYIPKGIAYVSRWYGNPKIRFYSVICNFTPDFPENGDKLFKFPLQSVAASEKSDKKAFKRLYTAFSDNDFFAAASVFYEIYGDIISRMTFTEERKHRSPVCNSIRFINENCCSDFDVKQLAQISCVSESRFYELFKKRTGCTPMEYKNKQRINRAAVLLSDRSNTVESVSEQLNFSSPAYFRRVFKAVMGKTPKEYRKDSSLI